jgi:citrate lyase beta subunit
MGRVWEAADHPAWDHPHPIHTLYGGAHLFKTETLPKLATLASRAFFEHCPNLDEFCRAFGLRPPPEGSLDQQDCAAAPNVFPQSVLEKVFMRIKHKLAVSPIDDYRIDFEDGLGLCSGEEEDRIASEAAGHLVAASKAKNLPPSVGIRIKSFATSADTFRAMRTLDIFLAAALANEPEAFPHTFIVTLPKVSHPTQVAAFVELLVGIKNQFPLQDRQIYGEIMIESPDGLINAEGRVWLHELLAKDRNIIIGVHFGAHDYLASLGSAGVHPNLRHPACDLARLLIKMALGGRSPLAVVDGAETFMPLGAPDVVRHGWQLSFANVWHGLDQGIFQGWDLHPAQIPARLAAVYTYFIAGLPSAAARLKNFLASQTHASRVGANFDDLATAQGLLNFFDRAIRCGAISADEARHTGLDLAGLRAKIRRIPHTTTPTPNLRPSFLDKWSSQ